MRVTIRCAPQFRKCGYSAQYYGKLAEYAAIKLVSGDTAPLFCGRGVMIS